jgi:tRNA-dihydrouridine synthase 3
VNTTRRYLCEALSFQYRYIPIGLLERLPGRLNDRPPSYHGRDELGVPGLFFEVSKLIHSVCKETMLASGDSRTWVKISEMFLGPAPDRFVFQPKHKSNAHGDEEAQG